MTDEEINLLEIGKRITERRKKLGMTQEMLVKGRPYAAVCILCGIGQACYETRKCYKACKGA